MHDGVCLSVQRIWRAEFTGVLTPMLTAFRLRNGPWCTTNLVGVCVKHCVLKRTLGTQLLSRSGYFSCLVVDYLFMVYQVAAPFGTSYCIVLICLTAMAMVACPKRRFTIFLAAAACMHCIRVLICIRAFASRSAMAFFVITVGFLGCGDDRSHVEVFRQLHNRCLQRPD